MKNPVALTFLAAVFVVTASFGEPRQAATPEELIQALNDLNGQGVENVIELTAASYDMSGRKMVESGKTFCHLNASKVTIRGRSSNPRDTVVFGDGATRVFYLNAAHLHNLTISNGYTSVAEGGGVACEKDYSTASVCSNCVMTCNVATGNGGGAAGVTCMDCEICGNRANNGGGASFATLVRGEVHDNTALASGGGAVSVKAQGVKVHHNTAVRGSGLSANTAVTSADCEIYDNVSTGEDVKDGGAVRCIAAGSEQKVVFTNCFIHGNSSAYCGGGAAGCALVDCVVSNNTAIWGGGTYDVTAVDTLIVSNRATVAENKNRCRGGGAYGGSLAGCRVGANVSDSDGGGLYESVVTDCVVSNNFSGRSGGGAYGGTLFDSRIVMNMSDGDGAGVNGTSVSNCVIAGNAISLTSGGLGGGAYDAVIRDSVIRDNFAKIGSAVHGGSVYGSLITNNASSAGTLTTRCTTRLEGCHIYPQQLEAPGAMFNCVVSGGGNPVTIEEGANVYTSGTFVAATYLIVNTQKPVMSATNCLFYGNEGDTFVRGPRNSADQTLSLVNCTIADNRFNNTFDAVPGSEGKNGSLIIRNCIFAGNRTLDGSKARDVEPYNWATDTQVYMSNCLIQQPPVANWQPAQYENIITNAPRFTAKGEYPYELKCSSPARGKGIVEDWMANATDIRGEGFARLGMDGTVDLGCYQCWLNPVGFMLLFK